MSRLVQAIPRNRQGSSSQQSDPGTEPSELPPTRLQEYGERVAKFVPSEVLAFYTAAIVLISGDADPKLRMIANSIVFIVAFIATPLWLGRFTTEQATKRANQIVGACAFAVWAYAYPIGLFVDWGAYRPSVGGLVLILFSLCSGFYQPKK